MTNVRPIRFLALLLTLAAVACSGNRLNPAELPADQLYQEGVSRYQARQFGSAIPLLDAFVQRFLGDPRAPEVRMMLGRAHSARREHISAVSHYQRLVEDFPTHPLNLEARYAICDAYVTLSPRPQLDQEYTNAAIAHCSSVATGFPGTQQAQQADSAMTELRDKLAAKAYDTGAFYLRRKAYDAAVVYFNDVLTNFAGTGYAPMALAKLVETYGLLGYVEDAAAARARLRTEYPESAEARALPPEPAAAAGTP